MLVIKIELWPGGFEEHKRTLGHAHIWNDGTGTEDVGNYKIKIFQWGKGNKIWKQGKVIDFKRQKGGPWDLLFKALKNVIGNREKRMFICH